jgi:hypothetical protein
MPSSSMLWASAAKSGRQPYRPALAEPSFQLVLGAVGGVVVPEAPGLNVASKGTTSGVGNTTGTPFTVTTDPNAPKSRLVVPLAWMI